MAWYLNLTKQVSEAQQFQSTHGSSRKCRLCKKGASFAPRHNETSCACPRGRTWIQGFPLKSQPRAGGLCSAPLGQNKMFQAHSLRGWYHRGANLSQQTGIRSVFQTPGERRTQFFSDIMRLGRITALLKKSTFHSAAYKGSLFEESLIKATQIKLQDLSCYFNTLIMYNSSSWGTNKNRFCVLKPITHEG